MADADQVAIIKQGSLVWNDWRRANPGIERPDLSGADLRGVNLVEVDFTNTDLQGANLSGVELRGAKLFQANLSRADLSYANLRRANLQVATLLYADLRNAELRDANLNPSFLFDANLSRASLRDANLDGAYLEKAILTNADLSGAKLNRASIMHANLENANLSETDLKHAGLFAANLRGANLENAILVQTHIGETILSDSKIYGISAWDLKGVPKEQVNLTITSNFDLTKANPNPKITVDDLQVAQFIYLLLNNKNVRNVIDTITSKVVLILGRFTDERKALLNAIKDALRELNYLPILFDFEGPKNRNITETVSTLAHMAKFVIADITDVKSIPHELMAIVPHLPSLPIQPLLLVTEEEYSLFKDYQSYPWMLPTCLYTDASNLIPDLQEKVIQPAETWLDNKKP